MNRFALLIVLTLGLVFVSGQAMAGPWLDAVNHAAQEMIGAQNDDGSFDWEYDGDATVGGAGNTQGATARGLVAAYKATGNGAYLSAANDVASWAYNYQTANPNLYAYNKDIEFIYELAEVGGADYRAWAQADAISYINAKRIEEGGTGAQAVYNRYLNAAWTSDSGVMDGAKLWMLGDWSHVGSLLGDNVIYSEGGVDYTGNDFANEMGQLLLDEFGSWDYLNDDYDFIGLSGIVEGMAFGDQGGYGASESQVVDALAGYIGESGGFQGYGYAAFALGLYDRDEAEDASAILMSWVNDGYFDIELDSNLESRGEALMGLSANPVPVPAAAWLLGTGLMGLMGVRRRMRG